MLKDGERLDDLGVNGWAVIQSRDDWRFSADTVYLARFASVRRGDRILDLGMGDGALSLLLLAREETAVCTGIEIRPAAVDRALRSIRHNRLEDRCGVIRGDIADHRHLISPASYTLAAANPPYARPVQDGQRFAEARCMPYEDIALWCRAASWVLENRGRFCVVYPCGAMQQMLSAMEAADLSLKRLEIVRSASGCGIFLAEGIKAARPGGTSVTVADVSGEAAGK